MSMARAMTARCSTLAQEWVPTMAGLFAAFSSKFGPSLKTWRLCAT
jgi:hypothetical protein